MNEMRKLMEMVEGLDFEKANEVVHPVEKQWHYPILTKFGYVPLTKTGTGFVRRYAYKHPVTGHEMIMATGAASDYWIDKATDNQGYWRELEPHLQSIQGNKL